jgi:hypothetical protein
MGCTHIKRKKLDGTQFFSVTQLRQRGLACEIRSKETPKHSCHNVHIIDCDQSSSDDETKDVYAVELVWADKAKPLACSSLQSVQKCRQEEVKFTFNVAKCDKI